MKLWADRLLPFRNPVFSLINDVIKALRTLTVSDNSWSEGLIWPASDLYSEAALTTRVSLYPNVICLPKRFLGVFILEGKCT